jgi:hypothetical protein
MSTPFLINSQNPDSSSIVNKETIDISLSLFDVSASGYSSSVTTNYTVTGQTVLLPRDNGGEVSSGNVYYTPLYKEKINYEVWKSRVNKNFKELT